MTKLINILLNRAVERLISLVSYPDLFKGVADRLPLDGLATAINDNLSYSTLANTVDLHKVARNLDYDDLAKYLDYETLVESMPSGFDYEQVARNIDARELAEQFSFSDKQCRTMMQEFDYGKLNATLSSNDFLEIARAIDYQQLAGDLDYSKFPGPDPAEVVKKATEAIIDELDMTVFARQVGAAFGEDAYRQVAALVTINVEEKVKEVLGNLDLVDVLDIPSQVRGEISAQLGALGVTKSAVEENVSAHLASLGITKDGTAVEKNYREMVIRDEVKNALANERGSLIAEDAFSRIVAATSTDRTLIDRILDRAASMLLDRAVAAAERGEVS